MKYRIKEIDGYFYPQYKEGWFSPWEDFKYFSIKMSIPIQFTSLNQAKEYIQNSINSKKVVYKEPKVIIHEFKEL